MKLTAVSVKNFSHLFPSWAMDPLAMASHLDEKLLEAFELQPELRPSKWSDMLKFWIEIAEVGDSFQFSLKTPKVSSDEDRLGLLLVDTEEFALRLPINAFLKGSDKLVDAHTVYMHAIMTDVPLCYIGITKNPWYKRLAQHRNKAANGSNLLFHRALREHDKVKIYHAVLMTGVPQDTSFRLEEEWVEMLSLYPLGLNMIPGGLAGLKYLSTLGILARTVSERDYAIQALSSRETVGGRANPLCAARWVSDQDFVNRVICGHSGRLTSDQVRLIRMLAHSGKSISAVASYTETEISKVAGVVSGRTYARVA